MSESSRFTPLAVVEKALADPEFKARLLADPAAALAAQGYRLPPGTTVKVCQDTEQLLHLVLPKPRGDGELVENHLEEVVGGAGPPSGPVPLPYPNR